MLLNTHRPLLPFDNISMICVSNSFQKSTNTVYPKKYAHGFVVLCFVVVMQSFIMNSHEVFIHIHQGCFAGTRAIVGLPQCQWSKPDGYWKISQCITTTKHSKAKTVCIFLGIYCTCHFLFKCFLHVIHGTTCFFCVFRATLCFSCVIKPPSRWSYGQLFSHNQGNTPNCQRHYFLHCHEWNYWHAYMAVTLATCNLSCFKGQLTHWGRD